MNDSNETAVVMLSAKGRSAIAVILVEGPRAVEVVADCFIPLGRADLKTTPVGKILFGHWESSDGEELVVTRRSTDAVEVHCHGGIAAPQNICSSLIERGCVQYQWIDWSAKNKHPITVAAIDALTTARTEAVASHLIVQMQGALLAKLKQIEQLIKSQSIDAAVVELQTLLDCANFGKHLTSPWRIVLTGPVNVGKSSLINAILGYQRSIVYDTPGTTRDVVTAITAIDGWPVELIDTAGLRESSDQLETAGIQLAKQQIDLADLILVVHDISQRDEDDIATENNHSEILHVYNKCDLQEKNGKLTTADIKTSATSGQGIDKLLQAISGALLPQIPEIGEPLLFTECQETMIEKTLEFVLKGDVAEALRALARLTFSSAIA